MSITNPDIATQQAFRRQKIALFRRLRHNLFYKCTALLSAIGLFVFVQTEHSSNPPLTRDIWADITYVNLQPNLDTENLPRQVLVTVSGPRLVAETLRPSEITVTADMANRADDSDQMQIVFLKYEFRLPTDVASQIHVERPLSLKVALYTIKKKEFNVSVPDLPAPAGFRFGTPLTDPNAIICKGRKDPVDQVDRVVPDLYSIAKLAPSASGKIQGRVPLVPLDRDGSFVPGITIEPKSVNLQIPLIEDLQSRNVTVSVRIDPPPDWTIEDVHVYPPLVRIKGLPNQLLPIYTISAAPLVLRDATPTVTRETPLLQPSGVLIYDLNGNAIRSVKVTVTLKKAVAPPTTPATQPGTTSAAGGASRAGND